MAALIVVMETKAAKAFGAKGIADFRLKPTRKIAARCHKAHRNEFDSLDAEEIAEPDGKIEIMPPVVGNLICQICLVVC